MTIYKLTSCRSQDNTALVVMGSYKAPKIETFEYFATKEKAEDKLTKLKEAAALLGRLTDCYFTISEIKVIE